MKPTSSCKVKPFFPCQVLQPDYVKCVVRNQTFGWWTCWVIDAEERTKHGTPALSPNHQGLNGETGKDLCTGSGLSWIAVVASNRFPPCILPLLPSVLNAAEKWAFSVLFQTMWLLLSEPSHSFLPKSTCEYKPWQWPTGPCHDLTSWSPLVAHTPVTLASLVFLKCGTLHHKASTTSASCLA